MTAGGRASSVLRIVWRGLLGLLALLVLLWAVMLAVAEWQHRSADPGRSSVAAMRPAEPARPVLILLHGAGLNGRSWDPVRRLLEPKWRVLTPDLPGHGAYRDEVYSLESAAVAVQAVARSVAPSPVLLVGDSLGGYSALAAAAALPPGQLRGLVVAGAGARFGAIDVLRYLKDVVVVRLMVLAVEESKLVAKVLGMMGFGETDIQAVVAAGTSASAVPLAVRSLLLVDFRPRLAAIRQPVLIANGTLDQRAMAQEASLLAALPQGEGHHFENCEHGVSLRRPAEFAALVDTFASRAFAPPARLP